MSIQGKSAWFRQPAVRYGLIFGLLALAFALRLYRLTWLPFSRDEIVTVGQYVPLSLEHIFTTYYSNNHPLASALAHLFSPQADHLFMLRWPSILVGLVTLPVLYRLGTALFNRRVGLLAFFLVSVTPAHIGYAAIVRGYGGLITLSAILTYLLWRAWRYNRWSDWAVFFVGSIFIVYFHLFGMLAAGMMLTLFGLALLKEMTGGRRRGAYGLKFGLTAGSLAVIYAMLVYTRTQSVLAEGGYAGEFELWRDGFSSWDDLSPLKIFIGIMAPLSSGGVAAYFYLLFWAMGWVGLWRQRRFWALAALIWFLAPFGLIFIAMQVLGQGFYAYVRFLVYLLPTYLLLAAVGMLTGLAWLSRLSRRWGGPGQAVKTIAVAVWLVVIIISLNWYFIRATNTNWPGLAQALVSQLQLQDITICEEYQRGLAEPDRAKPYCIWMLDFFTDLTEYTPRFQSTTDFIANQEHIHAQQEKMLKPGGVGLALWQRIVFNVEHLITDEAPLVTPLPPPAALAPYPAQPFGAATLIYVNSEPTLLGNVSKTVELLAQIDPSPAARARYYRSLAEIEAVQGHQRQAEKFFDNSQAMLKQVGGVYPEQFLDNTRHGIQRIPPNQPPPKTAYPAGYKFGPSIFLQAYEVSPTELRAGQPVTITLYWRALETVNADYTFFWQFDGASLRQRLEFDPFDRTYPTPWWWPGQHLVEQRVLVIPADMPAENFVIQLGAFERRESHPAQVWPLFSMSLTAAGQWQVKSAVVSASP